MDCQCLVLVPQHKGGNPHAGCHGGRARRHGNWKAGTRAANSQLNPSASARPHHDRPRPRVEKTTVACLPFDAGGARTNEEEKADRPI